MSLSKEEAMKKAKDALERAQKKYDKALEAWQDEVDMIVLKPMHIRSISRKQAVQIAKAIENDECFAKIMAMGLLPGQLQKEREEQKNEEDKVN